MIVITKTTSTGVEKIAYIENEKFKEYVSPGCISRALKVFQAIERKFLDPQTLINLKITSDLESSLENINLYLEDKKTIKEYETIEEFLLSYAEKLLAIPNLSTTIHSSLTDMVNQQKVNESKIAHLYVVLIELDKKNSNPKKKL